MTTVDHPTELSAREPAPYAAAPPVDPEAIDALDQAIEELDAEQEEAENQPPAGWVMLRELVETIVLALIIFLLMRQVIQNYRIESSSMQPNFVDGQFILVSKLSYVLGEPGRGDVVVFNNPRDDSEDYIKRIIALPGDTLEIADGAAVVNGQPLDEPYIENRLPPNERHGPLVIDDGHLFVMGDNRTSSLDSRSFGPLDQDLLVGKAWLRVWPFDVAGLVPHPDVEPGVPTQIE